jgi:hypothetical protein
MAAYTILKRHVTIVGALLDIQEVVNIGALVYGR